MARDAAALLAQIDAALAGSKLKKIRRASAKGILERKKALNPGSVPGDAQPQTRSDVALASGPKKSKKAKKKSDAAIVDGPKKGKKAKKAVTAETGERIEEVARAPQGEKAEGAKGKKTKLGRKERLAQKGAVGAAAVDGVKRKAASEAERPEAVQRNAASEADLFDAAACSSALQHLFEGSIDVAGGSSGSSGKAVLGAEAYRRANKIACSSSCPAPFERFQDAAPLLGDALTKVLHAQGYTKPTPIQAQSWPIALSGLDMVGVAQTGSGKTCAFLLPALVRIAANGPVAPPVKVDAYHSEPARPSCLVVAPTRELAQQISGEAEKFAPAVGARVVCLFGGVPKGDQVRELKLGADIMIACPGRLLDLEAGDMARDIWSTVSLEAVTYLVLDEADRMLDMGFEPSIRAIVGKCPGGGLGTSGIGKRQTLFFTATWPSAVQNIATSITKSGTVQVRIGQASGDQFSATKSVTQSVAVLREDEKIARLRAILKDDLKAGETAIVFAARKPTCDHIEAEILNGQPVLGHGGWLGVIHGDKEQWERDQNLATFRERTTNERYKAQKAVIVATDVASRGLDIPGVALVVVYDFGGEANRPGVDSYVHRIGRTGRAGKTGRSMTFFTPDDNGASAFVDVLKGAQQKVPAELQALVAKDKTREKARAQYKRQKSDQWKGGSDQWKSGRDAWSSDATWEKKWW